MIHNERSSPKERKARAQMHASLSPRATADQIAANSVKSGSFRGASCDPVPIAVIHNFGIGKPVTETELKTLNHKLTDGWIPTPDERTAIVSDICDTIASEQLSVRKTNRLVAILKSIFVLNAESASHISKILDQFDDEKRKAITKLMKRELI